MNDRAPTTDEILSKLGTSMRDANEKLPTAVFPLRNRFNVDRLEELEAAMRKPIAVPAVGEAAANALMLCFNTTANDIIKVAQEQVDRANLQLEEAKTLKDQILSTGQIMCDRIRSEAVRGAKVSEVMRVASQVINEPMATDHTGEPTADQVQPQKAETA